MRLKTKAGLALVLLGISIFAAWRWWSKTRNLVPLDVLVLPLSGQSFTSHVRLNFDALYLIEIEAQHTLPPEFRDCLLGIHADPAKCGETQPIAANWTISSGGHEIAHSDSAAQHAASAESRLATKVLGEFDGKAGSEYKLQIVFTGDAAGVEAADPHLKVAVASIVYTDLQSAGVLAFSIAFICLLFGGVLLGIACYSKRRAQSDANHKGQ